MPYYESNEIDPNLELLEQEEKQRERDQYLKDLREQDEEVVEAPVPEPVEEVSEGPKDIYGNPWPPQMDDQYYEQSAEIAKDIVTGVGDTALGIAELAENVLIRGQPGIVSGIKKRYQEQFPTMTPVRKLSGLLLPMLYGGAVAQGPVKGSSFISQCSCRDWCRSCRLSRFNIFYR